MAVHEKNKPYEQDFIMFRLDDFVRVFGPMLDGGQSVGMTGELREVYEQLREILQAAD